MRKTALSLIIVLGATFLLYMSFTTSTGKLYVEYGKLREYRRISPDFLPNSLSINLFSAGHTPTYADMIWIDLIQYIGDNVWDSAYRKFANPLIGVVTTLHPHFVAPYTLALVLAPELKKESEKLDEYKKLNIEALKIGEIGMEQNCDQEKLRTINSIPFEKRLWEDASIRNPCSDGMLPYYTAYVANELGDYNKAEYYYKVATANEDAPLASRFLGPLTRAREGDHKEVAERLLLIALEGYDEAPYICRGFTEEILGELKEGISIALITKSLRSKEEALPEYTEENNQLISGDTSCRNSLIRSMKQLYLAEIAEISAGRPDITTGEDLIKAGLIGSYRTIKEQDGWGLIRDASGVWRYRTPKKK